jgi:50S ribosomal protein L16 3-hydroxylase
MDIDAPLPLLGGLSPARFMQRHWQRKPLLVRGAVPGIAPLLDRDAIRALAGRDDVESRIVEQGEGDAWKLRRGPFGPRGLPAFSRPRWTVLLQGLDLHLDTAHALLRQFRFIPDARRMAAASGRTSTATTCSCSRCRGSAAGAGAGSATCNCARTCR